MRRRALFREALEEMHALEGVTYSTLSHGEGWYFLELGKLYRAGAAAGPAAGCPFRASRRRVQPKYFDWLVLLKFCTAFEPYTKLYTASIRPQKSREFLLFDAGIPPFHLFLGGPGERSAGPCRAGRAAGRRAAVERLAGRLKAARRFRPDRRIDVRRRSTSFSPTSPGNARRSTKPSSRPTSPMARKPSL